LTAGRAAPLASATCGSAEGGTDCPDWVEPLAALLVRDGLDRRPATTAERADRIALRYASFLRWLERPHDALECVVCLKAHDWPGQFLFHTGQPTVVVAPQGHGKTNAASYLMELALGHRREWDVYTNVPFPWFEDLQGAVPAPPRLFAVHSATELMAGIANTVLQDRIPAVVLDESGQWLSSHDWRSGGAESWTKFTYVERHFRTRGPVLVYHTWKTVLEPLRQEGDLRGSYCRVIKAQGKYRIARVEDRSRWWVVEQSALPYLTLGLRGFDMDLDFKELGSRLSGSLTAVAQQALDYLSGLAERRAAEADQVAQEARDAHEAAVTNRNAAMARRDDAFEWRNEEIVRQFVELPETTNVEVRARYRTNIGGPLLARLRAEADRRREQVGGTG
jgi:hypothetical protein